MAAETLEEYVLSSAEAAYENLEGKVPMVLVALGG